MGFYHVPEPDLPLEVAPSVRSKPQYTCALQSFREPEVCPVSPDFLRGVLADASIPLAEAREMSSTPRGRDRRRHPGDFVPQVFRAHKPIFLALLRPLVYRPRFP